MNPDFASDRQPLPGAWRTKAPAPRVEATDYYATPDSSYGFRGGHTDFEGFKKPEPEPFDRSFDRYNGNQPVFPPMEDRQGLIGGEVRESRKRPMHHDNPGAAYYQPKMPRSHDSRSAAPLSSSFRFNGDSSDILQEEARKCIAEMSQELAMLENPQSAEFQYLAHTRRLLNEEISKITSNMNPEWLDVESSKSSVKVLKRVLLPRSRPGSNIVGRLMGVGGSTLRKMCQTYKCHISICGAGSRKNPKEEADLLRSGDSRYNHLACPLHAEVSTTGPPHLAYTRLGQILTLLHKIITVEERFEHDGLVFETSNIDQFHQSRRREEGGDDNGSNDFKEERQDRQDRSFRGRGYRGRGGPRDNYRNDQQQRNTSWRGNDQEQPEPEKQHEEGSPKPAGTSGRGRGRGGFVPRGGRGGFVPRRSE